MIWAEIKKALNSTLGTNNFKSLDEIIKGEKVFAPSNAEYISLISNSYSVNVGEELTLPVSFTPQIDGKIRLKLRVNCQTVTTVGKFLVNSEEVKVFNGNSYKSENNIDIDVVAGTTYTFGIKSTSGTFTIETLNICCTIIDLSVSSFVTD